MTLPISGLVQGFGFLVMVFLSYRFLKQGRKEKYTIGLAFGYGFLLFALSRIFLSIPSLFFLKDHTTWVIFEIIERTFLVAGITLVGYSVYSLIFPKNAKKISIVFALISVIIIIGFMIAPPNYYVTESGILAWKNPPIFASVLNFLLLMIISIPGIIVFSKNAISTDIKKVKIRSLVMALALAWATIPALFDFFIIPFFKIAPIFSEIGYFVFFFLIFLTTLFGRTSD